VCVTSFSRDGVCTVGPLPRWLRPSVAGVSCNVVACVPLCNILLLLLLLKRVPARIDTLVGVLLLLLLLRCAT
jgi:hypothetical protein